MIDAYVGETGGYISIDTTLSGGITTTLFAQHSQRIELPSSGNGTILTIARRHLASLPVGLYVLRLESTMDVEHHELHILPSLYRVRS